MSVPGRGAVYALDRLSPFDPSRTRRTLNATGERIDGRAVRADGTWLGPHPQTGRLTGHRLHVALGAGEAVVLSFSAQAPLRPGMAMPDS